MSKGRENHGKPLHAAVAELNPGVQGAFTRKFLEEFITLLARYSGNP
jgi:hypothetical protein